MRAAFTLVELLVVITIIIILIGLLTPVVIIALARAKEARIQTEIGMLDGAFKAYKEKHGSYPPSDFTNIGTVNKPPNPLTPQYIALANHLAKAFPRCNVQNEINAIIASNPKYPSAAVPSPISPAQAITFWLSGFCTDPEQPISGLLNPNGTPNPNAPREAPLIDFDKTRMRAIPGELAAVYDPADTPNVPYVYFASQNYATHATTTNPFGAGWGQGGSGSLRPYAADPEGNATNPPIPANPNSFQLISAGLDGDFGGAGVTEQNVKGNPVIAYFKSGLYYANGDKDNITNFSDKTLGDAIPK